MNKFDSIALTKYSQNNAINEQISQVLSEIMQNLREKLLKKEIKCECENKQPLCFDCLRFEAESMLTENLQIPEVDEENLEAYSDVLDQELDNQVAKLVANYEESI